MNINTLIIISCICMLFVIGRIFIVPIKWILKLAFNSVLGGVLVWIINMIGGTWGFHIGLNIYTSVLVRNFRFTWCSFFDFIESDYWIEFKRQESFKILKNIKNKCATFVATCCKIFNNKWLNLFIKIAISKIFSFKFLT